LRTDQIDPSDGQASRLKHAGKLGFEGVVSKTIDAAYAPHNDPPMPLPLSGAMWTDQDDLGQSAEGRLGSRETGRVPLPRLRAGLVKAALRRGGMG
jgi:hypothetical protein